MEVRPVSSCGFRVPACSRASRCSAQLTSTVSSPPLPPGEMGGVRGIKKAIALHLSLPLILTFSLKGRRNQSSLFLKAHFYLPFPGNERANSHFSPPYILRMKHPLPLRERAGVRGIKRAIALHLSLTLILTFCLRGRRDKTAASTQLLNQET